MPRYYTTAQLAAVLKAAGRSPTTRQGVQAAVRAGRMMKPTDENAAGEALWSQAAVLTILISGQGSQRRERKRRDDPQDSIGTRKGEKSNAQIQDGTSTD